MHELDWITIKGFRSIREIRKLQLRPLNILIGANGSGKSNFIGAFSFLREIREGRLQSFVGTAGGSSRILHFGRKFTTSVEFEISFRDEVNKYEISLSPTDDDRLMPVREWAYFWNKKYPGPYGRGLRSREGEAGISFNDSDSVATYVRNSLYSWRTYHFHDTSKNSPLKQSSSVDDNRFLRPDGSNLSSFLYLLKNKHENEYRMIVSTIRLVAPFFVDFVLEPSALNEKVIRLEWKHQGTDDFFDASSLSDGTLRFIALAVLLLQPVELRPSVILVDEPELGLHPYAITVLSSLFKTASLSNQIIMSTQSPFLLDNFEPDDVLVANRVEGHTDISRLATKDYETWLERYSLGQLWESGDLGGRPR